MKSIFRHRILFFGLAVILLWIKSYAVYNLEFDLDISNMVQRFLLMINPLSSLLIFLGITLFARGKRFGPYLLTIYTAMSLLLYSNIVFYRFNNDFITLPVLTQTDNFGSLGTSIADLMAFHDIL